ncbi:pyridoxamine 5'-phosphate oxidase family protein [Paenibacillus sambharensis]|uniref:Pyridoxamine 5'-phosphate oxidase family protein n=1 Tax=Paenibacillus sambharensis TaxID=1803190 RepID=A0A2W1LFB8_9BACL|nr:pyridoxamine 5'-phosphate oxidase family protein [Paenibacillus sambharensis]
MIRDKNRSFDLELFLQQPLFAHLSTLSDEGPRDSPVWLDWDGTHIWIIGNANDSFPRRIREHPSCAIGIIDYDQRSGKVLHAGFRGQAVVKEFDLAIARRLLAKYLGSDESSWDVRFQNLDSSNVLICFTPETVVVRDQSYVPSSADANSI